MALISPDVTLTAKLVLPDLISYLRLNSVAQSHHPSFSPSLPVLNFLLSPFTCSCLVMQQITSNSKLVVCQCRHSLSSLSLSIGQVAECYSPLKELVEDNSMKGYLPECWISYVKV